MQTVLIKGFEDYSIDELGNIINIKRNKKLKHKPKNFRIPTDYPCVVLYKNGKQNFKQVHRLLAISFIPNPNNYPEINHIDGVKNNYDLTNLEWCTKSHNIKHAIELGLISKKKIILNTITGIYYLGVKEAAKTINMKKTTLTSMLNGTNPNKTNFKYI